MKITHVMSLAFHSRFRPIRRRKRTAKKETKTSQVGLSKANIWLMKVFSNSLPNRGPEEMLPKHWCSGTTLKHLKENVQRLKVRN